MRAYERFLQYVGVHTTSDPTSASHPTTARQFDLANRLAEEMKALGISDVRVDEHCYVYGVIPATPGHEDPPMPWASSPIWTPPTTPPATTSSPSCIENYDGGDVTLAGQRQPPCMWPISPTCAEYEGPDPHHHRRHHPAGSGRQGGRRRDHDRRASTWSPTRRSPTARIAVCFTPDEEVGQGADHFDVEGFGAGCGLHGGRRRAGGDRV